jgi:hypothetical protein
LNLKINQEEEMFRDYFSIVVLVLLLIYSTNANAETSIRDSNNWEGSYECNVMPSAVGWTCDGLPDANNAPLYTTISNGILTFNTVGSYPDAMSFWEMPLVFDFNSVGISVEFKVKYIGGDAAGSACISVIDTHDRYVVMSLDSNIFNLINVGNFPQLLNDDFHIVRVTMKTGSGNVKVYVDNKLKPRMQRDFIEQLSSGFGNTIMFGDQTPSGGNSNWQIDWLRWTLQGTFPPYAIPVCGDFEHPYPMGDFSYDCTVDFADIRILAQNWLVDVRPLN